MVTFTSDMNNSKTLWQQDLCYKVKVDCMSLGLPPMVHKHLAPIVLLHSLFFIIYNMAQTEHNKQLAMSVDSLFSATHFSPLSTLYVTLSTRFMKCEDFSFI